MGMCVFVVVNLWAIIHLIKRTLISNIDLIRFPNQILLFLLQKMTLILTSVIVVQPRMILLIVPLNVVRSNEILSRTIMTKHRHVAARESGNSLAEFEWKRINVGECLALGIDNSRW